MSVNLSNSLPKAAIILVLQLILYPHRTFGTIAPFFLHRFCRFSLSTKKDARQLRFSESWAARTNAHFRVLQCVWNHHAHFPITPPLQGLDEKPLWELKLNGEFEYFGRLSTTTHKSFSHKLDFRVSLLQRIQHFGVVFMNDSSIEIPKLA